MKTQMTGAIQVTTQNRRVVSRDEWVAERRKLLAHEKELTRLGDQIARERRALPWLRIDKVYTFDTPVGRRALADLFDGRRQLLVQHFMLAPGWEQGCKNCSYMADHTDGATVQGCRGMSCGPTELISWSPEPNGDKSCRQLYLARAWVQPHQPANATLARRYPARHRAR
jgi:hypothetical protein